MKNNSKVAVIDGGVVEQLAELVPKIVSRLEEVESENRQLNSGLMLWSAEELAEMWGFKDVQAVRKYLKGFGVNPVVLSDRRATRYKDADIRKFIEANTEKPLKTQWKNK